MTKYSKKERQQLVEKVKEAYQSSKQMTINEACDAIGISRSSYYKWQNEANNSVSGTQKNKTRSKDFSITSETEQKIVELKQNKPFLGLKKISKQLAYSCGIKVSTRKVKKVLQKHNLNKTDYPKPKKKHHSRRFERLSRNEMWLMDIMYYKIEKEGRFYLISILDDYSRYIVSYGVFKKQTIDNVIDVLHQAIEEHGTPDEFLTDRGSQFHSWKGETKFEKLLKKLDIKHILASPKSPQTIGKIESFHRNIQRELLRQKYFDTIEEAKNAIDDYITYYNQKRVHMGLDYITPADRYFGIKQDAEKLLDVEANSSDQLYLTGRIEGQPLRAKENKQGVIEVFLAGQKIKKLDSSRKIKQLFEL